MKHSSYIRAAEDGTLKERAAAARSVLTECRLCPRQCGVDRLSGETGICSTGARPWVSSYSPHFGEERPLVGSGGSGTIFFTHCNLGCNFCQNYDISHEGAGEPVSDTQLSEMMLALEKIGCHNINFVTPSHVVPQILAALELAVESGLTVPIVYNTSAYDTAETLKLLDGIIDIYMPDFKFWDPQIAELTCNAPDYPKVAQKAVKEMHRQVGDLVISSSGIAESGLLVRHLVLPSGMAGTRNIMRFIAQSISPNTYVNIMPQYRPCGSIDGIEALTAPLSVKDFENALADARAEGITRLDQRKKTLIFF